MPKACGLSFEDLKPFMHRVEHGGKPINVLDLYGLKATKQTARARDIEDLRHIEVALAALRGEVSDHVEKARVPDERGRLYIDCAGNLAPGSM
jgi:hypothetical protein